MLKIKKTFFRARRARFYWRFSRRFLLFLPPLFAQRVLFAGNGPVGYNDLQAISSRVALERLGAQPERLIIPGNLSQKVINPRHLSYNSDAGQINAFRNRFQERRLFSRIAYSVSFYLINTLRFDWLRAPMRASFPRFK